MTTPTEATPTPNSAASSATPSVGVSIYGENGGIPQGEGNAAPAATPTPAAEPTPAPAAAAAAAAAPEPAKPAEAAPAATTEEKPPADPAARTAADYDYTFPEGFTVNADLVGKFKDLALKSNLDPAVAKEIQDFYVEAQQAQATQLQQQWTEITTGWHTEVMALPEFAQDRREKTGQMLGALMDEFATPEDRALLSDPKTGMGNYPPFIRVLLNMSRALMEGEPTTPGTPGKLAGAKPGNTKPATLGQAIYGDGQ